MESVLLSSSSSSSPSSTLLLDEQIENKVKEIETDLYRIEEKIKNEIMKPYKQKVKELRQKMLQCFEDLKQQMKDSSKELKNQRQKLLEQSTHVEFIQFLHELIEHSKKYCIFVLNDEGRDKLLEKYNELFDCSLLEKVNQKCDYFCEDKNKQNKYNIWRSVAVVVKADMYCHINFLNDWRIKESIQIENHPFTGKEEKLDLQLHPFYFNTSFTFFSKNNENKHDDDDDNQDDQNNKETLKYSCITPITFKEILEQSYIENQDVYIENNIYYNMGKVQTQDYGLLWFQEDLKNEESKNHISISKQIESHLEYLLHHSEVWKFPITNDNQSDSSEQDYHNDDVDDSDENNEDENNEKTDEYNY